MQHFKLAQCVKKHIRSQPQLSPITGRLTTEPYPLSLSRCILHKFPRRAILCWAIIVQRKTAIQLGTTIKAQRSHDLHSLETTHLGLWVVPLYQPRKTRDQQPSVCFASKPNESFHSAFPIATHRESGDRKNNVLWSSTS